MTAAESIARFRTFLEQCEPARQWDGDLLCLKPIVPIPFKSLRDLEEIGFSMRLQPEADELAYVRGRDGELAPGGLLRVEVPRQADKLTVVPSLHELIKSPGVVTGELAAYVICDDNILESYSKDEVQPNGMPPAQLQRFHECLRLWAVLQKWSDHIQEDGTILFFGLRRVTIEPGFSEADFPDEKNAIHGIEKFQADPDRSEVRKEILKAVLTEHLRDVPSGGAFARLLKATASLERRLRESLAIYLSEHSPERLQKEAEKSALALSEKLEAIISGLETKSLTIAPALLVAFKEALPGKEAVALNVVTFAAALLYGVSMTWAYISQRSLMAHLKIVAEDCIKEVKEQGLSEDNRALKIVFAELLKRLNHAKWGSRAICALSWIPTLVVIGYAYCASPAANDPKPESAKGSVNMQAVREAPR